MELHRVVKARRSVFNGACPAVYDTEDPGEVIIQGTKLTDKEAGGSPDVAGDETAVKVPVETLFHWLAKDAGQQGDAELVGKVGTFQEDLSEVTVQGAKLTAEEACGLEDVAEDETAVKVPVKTLCHWLAVYARQHDDAELAGKIEEYAVVRRK